MTCGARSGPIPAAFAGWLAGSGPSSVAPAADDAVPEPAADHTAAAVGEEEPEDATLLERFMPEPRSAAVATMAVLAFGVIIGAATGPLAQSAAVTPIIVEMGPAAQPEAPAE